MATYSELVRFEKTFMALVVVATENLYAARDLFLVVNERDDRAESTDLDRIVQKQAGDLSMISTKTHKVLRYIEAKVEQICSPNAFIEILSNGTLGPKWHNPGWVQTCQSDNLWYCFADIGTIAIFDLNLLRAWLSERIPHRGRTAVRWTTYPLRTQEANQQKNQTIGFLLPFRDIPPYIWLGVLCITDGVARSMPMAEFLAMLPNFRGEGAKSEPEVLAV